MKHQSYGGKNFPFVTSVRFAMPRWVAYAILATPVALLAGLIILIWWLV